MALLFWNKSFAQWLEHCWKWAIVPSGLSYSKVTNCPCIISRNLQGTSDSWASTTAVDELNLAISAHPSMLFSTEKRDKSYGGIIILNSLGSFPVFPWSCMHGAATGEIIGLGSVACWTLAVLLSVHTTLNWKLLQSVLIGVLQCLTMLNNGSTAASILTFWLVRLVLNKVLLWLCTSEKS